ncbi:MAG: hypothetical protein ACOYOA_12845, partial [Saprospiraceae bacterium]
MSRKIKFTCALFLVVTIFLISCRSNGNERHFSLQTRSPFVISKNGAEIFQYWEFKNKPFLWDTNFVQPPALQLYKDSVSNILGKDTFELILRDLAFQNIAYQSVHSENGDSINAQLIHAKNVGKIRPIN